MTSHTTLLSTTAAERVAHVWEDTQWWAIQAARAANRPLLIRGEPGIGKTQLAYAAAKRMNRPIQSFTIDSTTEARDLMWTFDAVERLAEAQVASHLYTDRVELRSAIEVQKFVQPGPLWWALNWESALKLHTEKKLLPPETPNGWQETDGVVILIDEIDKADSDVPNGLLEVFGMRQFTPQGWQLPIVAKPGVRPPLIVVTTNEERMLPDPFIRRCVVLHMKLPACATPEGDELDDTEAETFLQHLITRGKAHFGDAIPDTQLRQAAELLMGDRRQAILKNQHPQPGQAEYLDFLRAMTVLAQERITENPSANRDDIFQEISASIKQFMFEKQTGLDQ